MRLVLTLLLTLAAAPAWAEWVKVGESSEGHVFYIDTATIRRDGNLRRVWELVDLKQRDKSGEMSRLALAEYDCKEERRKTLSLSTHSALMAGGNVLLSGSTPNRDWDYIAPGTVSQTIMRIVCAK